MDNITVRLNYDLKNSDPAIWIMNHEAFKSNMDKLKLILFLCETKLEIMMQNYVIHYGELFHYQEKLVLIFGHGK